MFALNLNNNTSVHVKRKPHHFIFEPNHDHINKRTTMLVEQKESKNAMVLKDGCRSHTIEKSTLFRHRTKQRKNNQKEEEVVVIYHLAFFFFLFSFFEMFVEKNQRLFMCWFFLVRIYSLFRFLMYSFRTYAILANFILDTK